MIKLVWRFAILAAFAAGFAWLADNPGKVTVIWKGKEISTSVAVAVGFVLVGLVILLFLWNLVRRVWRSPRAVGVFMRERRGRKGYESLSRGIIAAGAGDSAAAARHAAIAGNSLADEPLVNVLAAQAAQLRGDKASVRRIFEAMVKSPDTEALGLRGLFVEARQAGSMAEARRHAEQALKLNPRLAWASTAVLQLQCHARDWENAAATLAQQIKAGSIVAPEGQRKQAAMLAAHALTLEGREPVQALDVATRALKLDPGLVPAALVAARGHIANGSPRKASRILHECWARQPHPDLAEVMAHLKPGDGPEVRFERVRDLVREHPGGIEGAIAVARAATLAQRWDQARQALADHLEGRPQARICVLLATIEDGEGDKGRAREWLARAVGAPRDPIWVSDGVASQRWTPVSPVSVEIVPCLWKAPFDMPETDQLLPSPKPAAEAPVPAPQITAPGQPVDVQRPAPKPAAMAFRPPDDPGVAADPLEPESGARRSLATES